MRLQTGETTGVSSWLRRVTLTQSPATTCMTSGSGVLVRALIAAASLVGTYAVLPPLELLLDRSMAVRSNDRSGALAGQGLPGPSEAGGAWPVGVGIVYGVVGGGTPSHGWRAGGSTRSMRTIHPAAVS